MTEQSTSPVLAVDGGGTGSRFALETGGDVVTTEGGPANVFTDLATSLTTIEAGLGHLARASGHSVDDLRNLPACFALAGVVDATVAESVARALRLGNAVVEDDKRAAVEGALGPLDGVVAALGTGSFFALKTANSIRLAGGWGSRVDDRASGFWLGREALTATLEAADGVGPATDLTERLSRALGGPAGIARFARDAPTGEIAALATEVDQTDHAGDTVAAAILSRAAAHVERMVLALDDQSSLPICLTGGVSATVARKLGKGSRSRLIAPRGNTLDGARARARRVALGARL